MPGRDCLKLLNQSPTRIHIKRKKHSDRNCRIRIDHSQLSLSCLYSFKVAVNLDAPANAYFLPSPALRVLSTRRRIASERFRPCPAAPPDSIPHPHPLCSRYVDASAYPACWLRSALASPSRPPSRLPAPCGCVRSGTTATGSSLVRTTVRLFGNLY